MPAVGWAGMVAYAWPRALRPAFQYIPTAEVLFTWGTIFSSPYAAPFIRAALERLLLLTVTKSLTNSGEEAAPLGSVILPGWPEGEQGCRATQPGELPVPTEH